MAMRARVDSPLPVTTDQPFRFCPAREELDALRAQAAALDKQDADPAPADGPDAPPPDADAVSGQARALADRIEALEAKVDTAPVYLIRVGGFPDRAKWRRLLAEHNAMSPAPQQLVAALREVVDTKIVAEDRPAWHELIARVTDITLIPNGDDAEGVKHWMEDLASYADLQEVAKEHSPRFLKLSAQKQFSDETAPTLACQMFLVGVENRDDVPFARDGKGLVSDATLRALGSETVATIGAKARDLLFLDKALEKN
ncbi:hypothetical protein [Nitrospirillum iridis]|uniref:Uncharacterized protein n=1 Tax=Nitrospirillum iridis TaxID=765888 RepID=A0A7X0EEG7_9PROT|nr:hypothetical protein [Nitrospirillum iridis]MBB6251429.1 hypothetical protein [Nitrospirillum iridis]